MPSRIKRARERIVISKLAIKLIRILALELSAAVRGASADDVMLVLAVFVGQAERKPMTPAKIAAYIGLARPTAIRLLHKLEASGIVKFSSNGSVSCTWAIINADKMMDAVDAAAKAIHRADAELSKMDTRAIA